MRSKSLCAVLSLLLAAAPLEAGGDVKSPSDSPKRPAISSIDLHKKIVDYTNYPHKQSDSDFIDMDRPVESFDYEKVLTGILSAKGACNSESDFKPCLMYEDDDCVVVYHEPMGFAPESSPMAERIGRLVRIIFKSKKNGNKGVVGIIDYDNDGMVDMVRLDLTHDRPEFGDQWLRTLKIRNYGGKNSVLEMSRSESNAPGRGRALKNPELQGVYSDNDIIGPYQEIFDSVAQSFSSRD